jgi:beta-N-acetylhexosaminidase
MRDLIARGVGGAILFKRNVQSAQQVSDLCAELKTLAGRPFVTCIDQEGGRVMRLGPPFTQSPSMRVVGQTADPELAHQLGQIVGRELRAVNIDMNFAPVLDVDTNPDNPVIADRSFGRTPQLVADMGLAMIAGLQSAGVAACGKHVPGHGDTSQDSHFDLPRLPHDMERLAQIEFPPFAAAARAGVAAIMTAHVIFEAMDREYPATMSKPVLEDLLRKRLGFQGLIVSDDLGMKAVANHYAMEDVLVRGVNAGIDFICVSHEPAEQNKAIDLLTAAVQRGDVSEQSIETAGERLAAFRDKFVRPPITGPLGKLIGCSEHQEIVARFGAQATGPQHDPTDYRSKK